MTNEEIADGFVDALNAGDVDALLVLSSDDIEIVPLRAAPTTMPVALVAWIEDGLIKRGATFTDREAAARVAAAA